LFQKAQVLTKRILSTQTGISHKSHRDMLGRAHKGLGMSIFMSGTRTLQMREGESFYACPQKLVVGN
jgi:hypothetical protein